MVKQPSRIADTNYLNEVCLLKKALYGLKQAPRSWYAKLTNFLIDIGFANSDSYSSLFTLNHNSTQVWLLVYVDDLIFANNCIHTINCVISLVCQQFKCRDLEELIYFLGMEAIHKDGSIYLNQSKYGMELLLRFQLSEAIASFRIKT